MPRRLRRKLVGGRSRRERARLSSSEFDSESEASDENGEIISEARGAVIETVTAVADPIYDPHLREGGYPPSVVATEGRRRQGARWTLTSRLMVESLVIGMAAAAAMIGLPPCPARRRRTVRAR